MDERFLDRARPPRGGEELDTAALAAYLDEHLPAGFARGELVVEQFPAGWSNLTYLLRYGDRELVLRRPPFGNVVKSAHDMGREFRVLHALQQGFPPAPEPYLYCEDEAVLGAPFYVMERRRGVVLRRNPPPGLDLHPERMAALCDAFVDTLARLHRFDWQAAGLGSLARGDGYVARQVQGWHDRYQRARTDDWPEFDGAGAWLLAEQPRVFPPGSESATLIHNDFKFDNVLLDADRLDRVIGVFDWEMCTVGEPLLDLGTSLAYWVEAGDDPALLATAFGPTMLPGSMGRARLAAAYAERMEIALDPERLVFAYVFGLYKLGVIVQQIYARYVKGLTRDPRFAGLGAVVDLLGRVARRAIDAGAL